MLTHFLGLGLVHGLTWTNGVCIKMTFISTFLLAQRDTEDFARGFVPTNEFEVWTDSSLTQCLSRPYT